MKAPLRSDPLARIDEVMSRAREEREQRIRGELDGWQLRVKKQEDEDAACYATLQAAVQGAEEPYHALLKSSEWSRTLAAIGSSGLCGYAPITQVDVPVHHYYRLGSLSFGPVVIVRRRIHLMAPVAQIVLKVEGTLLPIITWWETGLTIPEDPDSPVIWLGFRRDAYRTVIRLCRLIRRGRLLHAVQSAHLRRITGVPLYKMCYPRGVTPRTPR